MNPDTATGVVLMPPEEPSPSSSTELSPQQLAISPVVTAHAVPPLLAIASTPAPRPVTATGTSLSVVPPFPSWPAEFQPQQNTAPAAVSAQLEFPLMSVPPA